MRVLAALLVLLCTAPVAAADKAPVADRFTPRNFLDKAFHLTTYFARRKEKNPERLIERRESLRDVPLYPKDGWIDPFDAQQGLLHDCYFFGAIRTIARREPETIRSAIQQQADGSFKVRFFDRGHPEFVTVTPEFDLRYGGLPLDNNKQPRALWPAVLQQAWIQWKGRDNVEKAEYRVARTPLEAISGRKAEQTASPGAWPGEAKRKFEQLKKVVANRQPAAIITMPMNEKAEAETGLHGSHTYEVKDVGIDPKGNKFIELSENHSNDLVRISPEVMAKRIVTYEWLKPK